MRQRTTEWIEQADHAYHERQFKEPYRSTVQFCDWLESQGHLGRRAGQRILDLGCGQGANILYMAQRFPRCEFVGVDINPTIVERGNQLFKERGVGRAKLEVGDIYDLGNRYVSRFDGIVCFQTLGWLPEYEKPVESMTRLGARWFAASSLFYDGEASCTIQVKNYAAGGKAARESFYNIYCLGRFRRFLRQNGYPKFRHTPFEIDIDLPRPEHKGMGTYTQKLSDGHRIQFSGPLFLPWYFIVASK